MNWPLVVWVGAMLLVAGVLLAWGVVDVTRGVVHLVWSWHCIDCPARGDGLANQAADLAARKHIDATGHATVTSGKPG